MNVELKKPFETKITNITGDGNYIKEGKDIYKHIATFENGVVMTFTTDTAEQPFKDGDVVVACVNYESARGKLGTIKTKEEAQAQASKPPFQKSGSGWKPKTKEELYNENLIKNPSFALAYAQQFHSANGTNSEASFVDGTSHALEIEATAASFLKFLNDSMLNQFNLFK